ncbi:Mu transposase domain-containing protein [Streptomyces sp. NRRL F-5053]|uniref:Mu transposase domain-containing protein n=1 Tax=Streptomyces sp. NRRL F-5053 TaxID=1463854 RepID=UPI001F489CE5|nr:hypothetical protein [Streptomyces sp. NRRL F-5053]
MFASAGQETFFEGHVHALRTLGGVPRSKVRYDNLKPAVARVLGLRRARVEADRCIAFKSHFGIESFDCRPGIEDAHEKGGVEGQIGYFRRSHFVPVPEVSSLAELNEMVEQWGRQDDARRIGARSKTVAECFALEQSLLRPLPDEPFETGRMFTPRVDRCGQIAVRTNRCSVPIQLIGKRVRVVLHVSHLVVYDKNVEVARHERLIAKGAARLELDRYLEALVRKPGAFPGSTALEQARSAGKFAPVHDAWWEQAKKIHGERDGARALIEVLLLGRLPAPRACGRWPGSGPAGRGPRLRTWSRWRPRKAAQAESEPGPKQASWTSAHSLRPPCMSGVLPIFRRTRGHCPR